jgi:curli biogenesis system outer membrane secretion channel CsgG
MKATQTALVAVLVQWAALTAAWPQAAPGNGRLPSGARVAVIAQGSNGGSSVDRVVGEMLTTALRRAGLRVLERAELDAVLREQRLQREDFADPSSAVASGRVLGAQYLVTAKATEFGVKEDRIGGLLGRGPFGGAQVRTNTARVVLDVRVIDVETGAVLLSETTEGKQVSHGGTILGGTIGHVVTLGGIDIGSREWSESSLGKASRKAVDALIRRIAGRTDEVEGAVLATLENGMVVIGLGSADGIKPGQRLQVLRLERITDSRGTVVWTEERPVGEVRVEEVRADRAKAAPVEAGLAAREGDIVRTMKGTRK